MIFDGTWEVKIATPIGKQAVVLEIFSQDGVIRGTAKQGNETVNLINPVEEGNHLIWTQNVTKPLKLSLKFDVTVEGDVMTGTAKAGKLPTSHLTGNRVG